MSEVIDDGSSTAYGGFLTKEQREALRKKELERKKKQGFQGPVRETTKQEVLWLPPNTNLLVQLWEKNGKTSS